MKVLSQLQEASLLLPRHRQILNLSQLKLVWRQAEMVSHLQIEVPDLHVTLVELASWDALCLDNDFIRFYAPYKLYDQARIQRDLQSDESLRLWGSVGSTQQFALKHSQAGTWFYLAESQRLGKGRRGQSWYAGFASSILMSYRVQVPLDFTVSTYPMLVALVWVQWMQQHYPFLPLQLKWPNDIFLDDKKVAGILVDFVCRSEHAIMVLGVGCNISSAPDGPFPATYLNVLETAVNKTTLTLGWMYACREAKEMLSVSSFASFVRMYNACHLLHGQDVQFTDGGEQFQGRVLGVCGQGKLQVAARDRCVFLCSSDQIHSVRMNGDCAQ